MISSIDYQLVSPKAQKLDEIYYFLNRFYHDSLTEKYFLNLMEYISKIEWEYRKQHGLI
jgi:hypothetical protein